MSGRATIMNCLVMFCCLLSMPASAVTFNAFADVVFGHSSRAGETSGFELGQLDLWASHIIDEDRKLKTFIELVVESEGNEYIIDLERVWVEYAADSGLKIRAGQFHTSLGYWNRIFHHGAHMQVSVGRPLFLGFEDESNSILPVHTVGVMAVKKFEPAVGKVRIELQLGNGSHIEVDELHPGSAGDVDNNRDVIARLFFSPNFFDGFGLGVSYLNQKVSLEDISGNVSDLVDQNIFVADVSYIVNKAEILFEYYVIKNEDIAGITRTSTAWYAQAAYTFSEKWTPYVRYEFLEDIDPNDPYFITLSTSEYSQALLGIRYDLDINSSVKLEGRALKEPALIDDSSSSIWAQWTFSF